MFQNPLRLVIGLSFAMLGGACSSHAQEGGELTGSSAAPVVTVTSWCAGVPNYAPSYLAYENYANVVGPTNYGGSFTWVGENFDSYSGGTPEVGGPCNGAVKVECASDPGTGPRSNLDVTKACLCATSSGSTTVGRPSNGVASDNEKFRVVARAEDGSGNLRLFQNAGTQFTVKLTGWTSDVYPPNEQANQGISAFIRYRTEDDTYVASVKSDGAWFIKRVHCGSYTPVDDGVTSPLNLGTYTVRLRAVNDTVSGIAGVRLYFTLQAAGGSLVHLTPTTGYFDEHAPDVLEEGGTVGIRTDFLTAELDDWTMY